MSNETSVYNSASISLWSLYHSDMNHLDVTKQLLKTIKPYIIDIILFLFFRIL